MSDTDPRPIPEIDVVARIRARTSGHAASETPQNVEVPQFARVLRAARRCYGEVSGAEDQHNVKVREFVARSAMVIQAAQDDPEAFREARKEARVKHRKGERGEVVAIRVAAGDPGLRQPKWANSAAFVATPPDGDPSPESFESALAYLDKRGGMKNLSNLWTVHLKERETEKEPKADVAAEINALLDGLPPDFDEQRVPEGKDTMEWRFFCKAPPAKPQRFEDLG
jgi:hypothetical protein